MKIILFGLGSIGKRYIKILKENFSHEIFAFRSSKESSFNDAGVNEIYTWKEVEELRADVAVITNPTFLHGETALKCAFWGMHLFIEKPLSNTMEDIKTLESVCGKKNLTCYTAYCLRFHPVIQQIKALIDDKDIYHVRVVCSSYLPHWRKESDHKKSYSAIRSKGGGVLLDLSHEFDYIQYLFGSICEMRSVFGKASDVTLDAEDFADVFIKLDNSVHVNLHLNFLSLYSERTIKVDFKEGYLIGDFISNQVVYFYNNKKEVFPLDVEMDTCFKQQLRYYFEHISDRSIMNGIHEAKCLLKKILELKNG